MTDSPPIIQMAFALLVGVLVTASVRYVAIRARIWRSPPTDVLVLVAHPDDCVVLAGEYALWVLGHGRTVDVVYLTSGASDPNSPRAKTRESEALAAWSSVGVPASNLHFLRFGQSPMNGGSVLNDSELDDASARIAELMLSVESGTAVFLPAAGETHTDHKLIRRVGLKAVADSRRTDLLVLEAPEYNPCLSLVRSPGKVLQYLLRSLPLVWRLGAYVGNSHFPGFIRGGCSYCISDGAIDRGKRAMLRHFVSEDGEKLVRHFGFRNQFRPVAFPVSAQEEHFGPDFLKLGRSRLGLSVVGLWLSIYLFVVGISWYIAPLIVAALPDEKVAMSACSIVTILLVLVSLRARKRGESFLLYVSALVGMIGGLVDVLS